MPIVRRVAEAERDLETIMLTIGRDNATAALRWFDGMADLFDLIATQPQMGTEVKSRTSTSLRCVSNGSYVVYFQPIDDGIEVVRVVHGARDQRGLA